jgi:tetratricopeptide (TPR) repeat protein
VDEPSLVHKLAAALDSRELREALQDDKEELKFRLRRVFRQLEDEAAKPFLLVLDDFEANLEPRNDGYVLQPEAVTVLEALVWAIGDTYAPHRLILTCRYDFESNLLEDFYKQPLEGMRGADLRKKCSRLSAFDAKSQVNEALQSQARRLADGNPRLLEWLDKVLLNLEPPQPPRTKVSPDIPPLVRGARGVRGEQNTVAEILARLEADPVELREQVLAEALLAQIDKPLEEMLQRGLVFELPVPTEALAAVCESIPNLDRQINRAVALGLLEVSPDSSLRVPRILPLRLQEDAETLHKQAAEMLYCLWAEEGETATEEQRLEIHRLALRAKQQEIAAKIATTLSESWYRQSRFREAVQLYKSTLDITEDYRVLHWLAFFEQELGEVDKALQHYQQALNLCPAEDEAKKAETIHDLAILKVNQGEIEEAITLFQQSLEINERIGNDKIRAATLNRLGILKANQGESEEAITLFQQSLELKERIGNVQGKAVTLHELGRLKANQGEIEEAIILFQQSLEITEYIGNVRDKAATLHELGRLKANQGEIEEAIILFQQSLTFSERIGNIQGVAATLNNLGKLKADQGKVEEAITLFQQSMALKERIGNVKGKAATLHELGRLKANQGEIEEAIILFQQSLEIKEHIDDAQGKAATLQELGNLKVNQGEIEEAIVLFQESLEINERIRNIYGKAMTLQSLGGLAADVQGDFDTALDYLQQSLEILERLKSPDAEKVRQAIVRVQQMRDDIQ